MAWFGGKKKKVKKSPPVLEPVGNTTVQAAINLMRMTIALFLENQIKKEGK